MKDKAREEESIDDLRRRIADLEAIASEYRRAERRLAAQYAVTRILAESPTLADAASIILQTICETLGWELGSIWKVDKRAKLLRCVRTWHQPSIDLPEFESISQKTTLPAGTGLPGRVWSSGAPAWIPDIMQEENFPRIENALKVGLRSAVGFPILIGGEVLGVFEFFSREVQQSDEDLIQMMFAVGIQIGQFIERRRAEEIQRESEARYRIIAETVSDAILTIDEESRILFVNRAAARIFGYSIDEMLGHNLTMIIPDYLKHAHEASLKRYVETGKKHISWEGVELPALHKSGREIPVEISFGEFIENDRHIFTGVARDITDRKQAEEERSQLLINEQQSRKEAEEANRLKDEFLATVSHELRTPITAILGWARLLRGGRLDRAGHERALETIERNAKTQAHIVEDILDVSRIITGNLRLDVKPVELVPIIWNAIDTIRPAADAKGIRLRMVLDSAAGQVSGDSTRLQQVLWNLLSNAVKFSSSGGYIEVKLERTGAQLEISVSDTGKGISPEFQPFVFDRFRQADSTMTRKHGGLGLGLAIARHIIELHGGTIHVYSNGEGEGSTFTIKLPLLAVQIDSHKLSRSYPVLTPDIGFESPPSLDGVRVLVVDDEPDAREVVTAVLEQCGAEVKASSSAAEAIKTMEEWKPDVLISDIGMPEEDGYDLIRKVRAIEGENGEHIPAAALTAFASTEDRMRVLSAGYQTHIPKPVEPSRLAAAVASLTGRNAEDSDLKH